MAHIFRKPKPGLGRLSLYLGLFVGAALALNGWIFSTGAIAWSRTLDNPGWAPPGPVIGAVWTGLFALLAVAAFVIDRHGRDGRRTLARVFVLALWLVCMGWTAGYFGLREVASGFYVTVAAFALGLPTLILAARASLAAALLLVPLQAWLGFALALSWTVWQLNA